MNILKTAGQILNLYADCWFLLTIVKWATIPSNLNVPNPKYRSISWSMDFLDLVILDEYSIELDKEFYGLSKICNDKYSLDLF